MTLQCLIHPGALLLLWAALGSLGVGAAVLIALLAGRAPAQALQR